MSSQNPNRANSAVSRGGTGAVATPANSVSDAHDGWAGRQLESGRRDRPDVARGTDNEGIMDKIKRTSNTGIGKDTSSKATSIPERFGFDSRGDDPGVLDKAATTASTVASEVKNEAKDMMDKAQQKIGNPSSGSTTEQRRRRSSLMSKKEMSSDFLSNYSYEMRSEIGEP